MSQGPEKIFFTDPKANELALRIVSVSPIDAEGLRKLGQSETVSKDPYMGYVAVTAYARAFTEEELGY